MFASGEKVFLERLVLVNFGVACFLECIGTIVKGACDVNYGNTVSFFNNDIRAEAGVCSSDSTVRGDVTKPDGVRQAVHDLIMAGTDRYHLRAAVA